MRFDAVMAMISTMPNPRNGDLSKTQDATVTNTGLTGSLKLKMYENLAEML